MDVTTLLSAEDGAFDPIGGDEERRGDFAGGFMSGTNVPLSDPNMLLFPRDPSIGALGSFAKQSRLAETREMEAARENRIWEIRAFVSDSIPLAGDAAEALARPSHHKFLLNESPLRIYLHKGGWNAIYYELVGDENRRLTYIAVRVQSRLPSNALLLARQPINALLDVLTRDSGMPLLIQRLELVSPVDAGVLITEMLIPDRNGIILGPLGGIMQAVPFAAYDALYREALTSSSPFYRLLCAWKIYEGTNRLRRWLHEQCAQLNIVERLPPDPDLDPQELTNIGFDQTFVAGLRKVADLFNRLGDLRDAIAHFLIERDGAESHVYLADGMQLHMYAMGASALLRYAHRVLEELRLFYVRHLSLRQRGMVLPMPENRDQFIVRAQDHGLD
jgi:hypothetical protein